MPTKREKTAQLQKMTSVVIPVQKKKQENSFVSFSHTQKNRFSLTNKYVKRLNEKNRYF